MTVVHPFYAVFRGVMLPLGIVQLMLYAFAAYRDRASRTHRITQLTGIVGSSSFVALHIDGFGGFGIYELFNRLLISGFVFSSWWICLVAALNQAGEATLSLTSMSDLRRRRLVNASWIYGVGIIVFLWVSALVPTRASRFISLGLTMSWNIFLICGVNYVYFRLRQHNLAMSKVELTPSDGLERATKRWRTYAIFVTIFMLALFGNGLRSLLITIQDSTIDSVRSQRERTFDLSQSPSIAQWGPQVGYHLILWLIFTRFWRRKPEGVTSTRKGISIGQHDTSSHRTASSSTKSGTATKPAPGGRKLSGASTRSVAPHQQESTAVSVKSGTKLSDDGALQIRSESPYPGAVPHQC